MRNPWRVFDRLADREQLDPELQRSCLGRLASMLTFVFIMSCLGIWITAFLLLKDSVAIQTVPAVEQLTCVIFFGGLALAVIIASLAGNLLRRILWRSLGKGRAVR
ncbi:MAG: hypothetical protein JXB85_04355 [Anaerolineales bacterium]|nr:hypothetical protein [Anaerolineales bacterium]